uniref:Rab-GAP TBC domain-containing protein n=1 Tax=Heligmosomoides polygyrus TaxID=6339 RepID=A0A183GF05_HELPZ
LAASCPPEPCTASYIEQVEMGFGDTPLPGGMDLSSLPFKRERPERPGETQSNSGSRTISRACSTLLEEVIEEEGEVLPETDRFGFFVRSGEPSISLEKLRKREKKWIHMLDNWRYFMDEKYATVRERCRKGIPPSLRGKAWKYLCGAMYQMEVSSNRTVFDKCITQPGDAKWIDDIEKDLNRQFPNHEMFARTGKFGDAGKEDLFQLLKAWTVLHPEEGYCQGQAPIASVLLMHMPLRDAFYCFVQLCHRYLPDYYSPGLVIVESAVQVYCDLNYSGSRASRRRYPCSIIEGEIKNKLPAFGYYGTAEWGGLLWQARNLRMPSYFQKRHNVDPVLYMVEWFMCVFCRTLPWPTVLRVWDMFFCEGAKVLFKVAIVLFKYGLGTKDQCKQYPDLHSIITRLRNLPQQITSEEFLVEKVCEVSLNDADLEKIHTRALKLRQMKFTQK